VKWLDAFTRRRQLIAAAYLEQINHSAVAHLAAPQEVDAHVYHLFVVKCIKRDALQAHLNACGVQAHIHYPVPAHSQEPCKQFRRDPLGLLESDRYATECLSLPCHPHMQDQDVYQVIEAVHSFKG
jgi:dTDP-4-amino-4,6-dideoxygalactose transaminase